ncbi:MAG: carbohydrate porin [Myxococcaceae bacterium]|jgi:carbohydrate-selective porin OprB|nr:carbohydrate porin [Myxococcaceae bacterium]
MTPLVLLVVLAQASGDVAAAQADAGVAPAPDDDGGLALVADVAAADAGDSSGEPPWPPPGYPSGDHLTTEWFGARTWLAEHGVTFDLVYAVEVFGLAPPLAPPGEGTALVNGHLDVAVTLDTQGLGLWNGGKLYVLGQNNHGPGINEVVGSATEVSNIEAAPYTQLGEFFYEQNFFDKVRVRLGKQDANREFGTPRFGGNFINNNFGMLPSSPLPSYPTNGLGAVALVTPTDWLTFKAAVFEGRPQVGSVGFDSAAVPGAGHFLISSLNVTHRFGYIGRSNGTSSLGAFRQQGQFDEIGMQGMGRTFNELWGVFAQHDERVYLDDDPDDPRCFTIIPRFGWAQPDRFNIGLFLGLSVAYHGFGMRQDDTVGIGAGWFTVGQQRNGTPGPGSETFVEVFYKWRLTKFFSLQPDVQYYRTPGGDGRDAIIVGTRLKLKL